MKNKNDVQAMLKEAGILFAITLIAGLLLGFVYELTKEPIRLQEEKAVQEACQAVFTDAGHFEELDPYIPSDDTAQKLSDTGITIGTVSGCLRRETGLCDPDYILRGIRRKYCFVCGNPSGRYRK